MTALIPGQPWPIAPWGTAYRVWAENDAWYTGSTTQLANVYTLPTEGVRATHRTRDGLERAGGLFGGVREGVNRTFWGRPVPPGEDRTKLHISAAGDVATLSSDLLFAKPPTIAYDPDEKLAENVQARLDTIMSSDQAHAWMAEGGEYASAFGACALTAVWDQDTADHVWVQPAAADVTIPEFRYGKLTALNLWSEYVDQSVYYRHIERHEPGAILHTLYQGTATNLGRIVPLNDRPETAGFAELVNQDGAILTGMQTLTAAWWLNMPAREWRKYGVLAEAGRSDYSGGVKGLFGALDETWSSWMRDLELGKARLVVGQSMLESHGRGNGSGFDIDRSIYTGLDVPGSADGKISDQIEQVQFDIRVAEHESTALALLRRILAAVGMGELDKETANVGSKTATEVSIGGQSRERTRDKKALYAKQAFAQIAAAAMELDGIQFRGKGGGVYGLPTVTFPPASQIDPLKNAQTIQALRAAKAASVETSVRMAHPDWTQDQVDTEVQKITSEGALADPTTVGNPVTDPEERLGLDGVPTPDPEPAE